MADIYPTASSGRPPWRFPRVPLDGALFAALALLVVLAWWVRDAHYLSAERGLGYAFGIGGVSCMLAMQLYSVRKRFPGVVPGIGLRYWFRAHMYLGVIGPTLILLHCNFEMGSANSQVAFWSMVIMMTSGVIGRFIYSRVHAGLYGERVKLETLAQAVVELREKLDPIIEDPRRLERPRATLGGQLLTHLAIVRLGRRMPADEESVERAYLDQLRVLSAMRIAERTFALWHVVHLPLVMLLAVSVAAHVIVVHAY